MLPTDGHSVGMKAYQTWRAHGHLLQAGRQHTSPYDMVRGGTGRLP
jgi:hypothetical protein